MKVLLISANTEPIQMSIFPVGLGAVFEATQKAGHQVKLIDLMNRDNPIQATQRAMTEFSPDIIGISIRNIDDQKMENPRFLLDQAKEVVNTCREMTTAPIVLGGAGFSIFPQSVLKYVGADIGIQGEGEQAFPLLLERIKEGKSLNGIEGICLPNFKPEKKRIWVKQLDDVPFPSPQLWSNFSVKDPQPLIPVHTRRGCPMNCSYCSTFIIEGRIIRKRSIDRFMDILEQYVAAGYQRFYFTDNTFNIPSAYAEELCRSIIAKALDISWMCIVYPGKLKKNLVALMAKAGCKNVSLGFESGCEPILRQMNKHFHLDEIRRSAELLADHGIAVMGFLLLGGPGETKESVQNSLDFVDALPLNSVRITTGIRIYPGTVLANMAVEEKMIQKDDDLLYPKFYMVKDLEMWLPETIRQRAADRPNWLL